MNPKYMGMCVLAFAAGLAAGAQEGFVSVEYDPAKITDEMRAQTETIAKALENLTPGGWKQNSMIERYTPVNLYDKINGRSELYNSYDVQGMTFVTFTDPSDPTKFVDVFLYDMNTPLGAFGVYSMERWGDNEQLDLGRGGYRTDTDLFFWKGPYYATILGASDDPEVQNAVTQIAEVLPERLEGSDDPLWGLEHLPKERLQQVSVKFFMTDALSLDFLTNVFAATYDFGDTEYNAFLSKQPSAVAAKDVRDQFAGFLENYADDIRHHEINGVEVVTADGGGGYYDAVWQDGNYVAGISGGEGEAFTLKAAEDFLTRLDLE